MKSEAGTSVGKKRLRELSANTTDDSPEKTAKAAKADDADDTDEGAPTVTNQQLHEVMVAGFADLKKQLQQMYTFYRAERKKVKALEAKVLFWKRGRKRR